MSDGGKAWPEAHFPLAEVQEWIAAALPGRPRVSEPLVTYAQYDTPPDLRVTARFDAGTFGQVVFKGCRFRMLAGSVYAHTLVSRRAPGLVPNVLASEMRSHSGSYLLYEPFEGRSVAGAGSAEALAETARSLARIQQATRDSFGETEWHCLQRGGPQHLRDFFDQAFARIEGYYDSAWATDRDGRLTAALRFPASEVLNRMELIRPHIHAYADELQPLYFGSDGYPLCCIDHGDMHAGNAVLRADGSVLIHDWENAWLSFPLVSMEKLLTSAWALDTGGGPGPWGYVPGTPTQALIRDAYLREWGWETNGEMRRAFDRSMCLAVMGEMWSEINWAEATGWPDGNPEWTAQLISRLFHHLGAVEG